MFKMNKNKKVMKYEKNEKNEKNHSLQFEKTYSLYNFFLAGPMTLHYNDYL